MTSDLRISASGEKEQSEASLNMSGHGAGSDVRPVQGPGACPQGGHMLGLVLPP